jgi:ATP-binding cassette, subfamily B, bacterial MsbA
MIPPRYLKLARARWRLLLIGLLCGGIAGLSSGFGVPYFVQQVFRRIFEDQTRYAFGYLLAVSALLPAVFLARGVFLYAYQYVLQMVSQSILLQLRAALFAKIQRLPLSFFERSQSGDLLAKLVGDTILVQNAVLLIAKDALIQPFTFVAGFSFLVYLSVQQQEIGFVVGLFILAPVMVLPVRYIGRHLRKRSRELQATLGDLTEVLAENLRGVVEVRAFNLQAREEARFDRLLRAYNRFALKSAKYFHLTQPLMEILAVSMVSFAFVYSYQKGIGFSLFASIGAALYFTVDAVKAFVKMVNGVQQSTGAFERIEAVLNEPDALADVPQPVAMPSVRGTVRFDNVSFSYTDRPALSEINVEIGSGTICALVGPSGAGKSTFAKLIPRFYDPTSGVIRIDGVDISTVRQLDLRRNIAFVPQHPVLFNGSVRDNIRLARPDASTADVEAAARAAFAHDFVSAMADGYDTQIGENAVRLSGGQRQRLALARAFLTNAPILILDEATSALDAESEDRIQQALADYAANRTVFIIAHRFATIRLANRILLFDHGRIIAHGSYEQLLDNPLFERLARQPSA